MLTLKIEARGQRTEDLADALELITQKVLEGYTSGTFGDPSGEDRNSVSFEVEGQEEDPENETAEAELCPGEAGV